MAATVTGRYANADGTPSSGHVEFTLCPPALDIGGRQRTDTPVVAELDENGAFTVQLVTDPELVGIEGGPAVYTVTEVVGALRRTYTITLPDETGHYDLPAMYPGDQTGCGVAVVPVPGPPGEVPEAPVDGQQYARQDAAWSVVTGGGGQTDHGALQGLADDDHPQYLNQARGDALYIGDAPQDGQQYARQDAAWSVVTGGGGETPDTGWRDVSGDLLNGWTVAFAPSNLFVIRRIGPVIYLHAFLNSSSATATTAYELPTGWTGKSNVVGVWKASTDAGQARTFDDTTLQITAHAANSRPTVDGIVLQMQWITDEPWPTVLPGVPG